jgi:hypothetical protein
MSKNKLATFTAMVFCLMAAAYARPQYGLVGAWDFENGWSDVSGVAPLYTGTPAGAVSVTTDPVRGKVATCTGNGRVAFGPSSGGKLNIPDVVSVACWVKISSASNGDWLPIWGKGPGGYRAFLHASSPTSPGFTSLIQYGLSGGNMWPWIPIDPNNKYNVWMHVGFSYDGDYVRAYLNGKLTQELQVEDFNTTLGWKRDMWADTACPYYFSIFGLSGYQYYFKGSLDDVAVYRGVLNAQDFNDLYKGTKTIHQVVPKPAFGLPAWDQSVVAAYEFEGDTRDVSPGPAADAVLQDGAAIVADVNQGNVLYGTGTSWYANCGTAAKWDNIGRTNDVNDGFTVTAWIKPDATNPDGWAMIASKGGAGFRMYYHSVDPTTGGRTLGGMLNAGDTPSSESMGNGGNMLPDKWYHVAIVYNAFHPKDYNMADPNTWNLNEENPYDHNDPNNFPGRMRGYIDGLAAFGHPSAALSPNHFRGPMWDTSADPLIIRAATGGFNGKIDDVRYYSRPLNQLEVRWVMNQKCDPDMIGADYNDDCSVTNADLKILANEWLNRYNLRNFAKMAEVWLEQNLLWPY